MLTHTCFPLLTYQLQSPHCSLTNPPASDSFLLTIPCLLICLLIIPLAYWLLRIYGSTVYSSLIMFPFFYDYARGRYALNGRVTYSRPAYLEFPFRVSRATSSHTRTFPFPSHVLSYCTNMDCQLVSGYGFVLCLPLPLTPTRYSLLTHLLLDSDSFRDSFTFHGYLYLYLAVWYIYDWRWGFVPHLQSTLQPP